jgi:hypothetical protein
MLRRLSAAAFSLLVALSTGGIFFAAPAGAAVYSGEFAIPAEFKRAGADTGLQGVATDTNESIFTYTVKWINFLLLGVGFVALLFVIYGGWVVLIGGDSDDAIGKGRKVIINAVIGLVLIISSFVIVNTLLPVAVAK